MPAIAVITPAITYAAMRARPHGNTTDERPARVVTDGVDAEAKRGQLDQLPDEQDRGSTASVVGITPMMRPVKSWAKETGRWPPAR